MTCPQHIHYDANCRHCVAAYTQAQQQGQGLAYYQGLQGGANQQQQSAVLAQAQLQNQMQAQAQNYQAYRFHEIVKVLKLDTSDQNKLIKFVVENSGFFQGHEEAMKLVAVHYKLDWTRIEKLMLLKGE